MSPSRADVGKYLHLGPSSPGRLNPNVLIGGPGTRDFQNVLSDSSMAFMLILGPVGGKAPEGSGSLNHLLCPSAPPALPPIPLCTSNLWEAVPWRRMKWMAKGRSSPGRGESTLRNPQTLTQAVRGKRRPTAGGRAPSPSPLRGAS